MGIYQIMAITGSYAGLLITVFLFLAAHKTKTKQTIRENEKEQNRRLEGGALKMLALEKDIGALTCEIKKKANKELVNEQFRSVQSSLNEIKSLLKHD